MTSVSCKISVSTMLALNSALLNYLELLTGERHALTPIPSASLPLFLRNRYEICSMDLFGRRHTLALDSASGEAEEASPSDYANQINLLRDKLGEGGLVLRSLPSYTRNRLWCCGCPVRGSWESDVHNSVVDLREHFPSQKLHRGKRLRRQTFHALSLFRLLDCRALCEVLKVVRPHHA